MTVLGTLAAAVPVTMALENKARKKEIEYLHNRMEHSQTALDFIKDTIEPIDFINVATSNGNHKISNGVLLSQEVIRELTDFRSHKDGTHLTSEKNMARAVSTAMNYYYQNHSRPISDDPDKEYSMYRQTSSVVTRAESTRREKNTRSTCPEVTIIETVVCAVPDEQVNGKHSILPHPHLNGVYIESIGDSFTMHGWMINSNPYHSLQSIGQPPTDGYIVQKWGEKSSQEQEYQYPFSQAN